MDPQEQRKSTGRSPAGQLAIRTLAVAVLTLTLVVPWAALATAPAFAAEGTTGGTYFGAAGASGSIVLERRGMWGELDLAATGRDVDIKLNVETNKVATGRGQTVVLIARRVARATEYRVRLRFVSDGGVQVAFVRMIGGNKSQIGPETRIANLVRTPGEMLSVRLRVTGTSPTTMQLRAWPAGQTEPSTWSRTVTDSAEKLKKSGWVGMRFGVAKSGTNVPIRYRYNSVRVSTSGPVDAPVPTPTPTATPTATPAPTGPLPTPNPTPTPSPTSTPTPTPPPNAFVVAPNGNDGSAGSAAAPWRTLQKAADTVSAGATVLVRDGTYSGFVLRRSGTAAAPITFAAYPGEQPLIDGRKAVKFTVQLSGVQHVHLVGLAVAGGFSEGHDGGGVLVVDSKHVEVRDSLIRDNKSFGIRSYNSTYVLIDGNDVTGNANGVRIERAGEGTRVTNNLIYENDQMMVNTANVANDDVGAEGVSLVKSTGRVLVSGNYIWGNRALSYDYGYDGGAFSIYAASNWTISDNVTWDNENVLETGTDANKMPCDNNSYVRNMSYGALTAGRTHGMVLRCASNTLVANNTFHGIQNFIFAVSHNKGSWGGSTDGLRIVNNIVSVSSGEVYRIETAMSSFVLDYNLSYVTGSAVICKWVAGHGSTTSLATFRNWTGYDVHGLQGDPRFMDVSAHDYRLRADSPAVDAGMSIPGVTDGYTGAVPDMGYYERP